MYLVALKICFNYWWQSWVLHFFIHVGQYSNKQFVHHSRTNKQSTAFLCTPPTENRQLESGKPILVNEKSREPMIFRSPKSCFSDFNWSLGIRLQLSSSKWSNKTIFLFRYACCFDDFFIHILKRTDNINFLSLKCVFLPFWKKDLCYVNFKI